MVIMKKAVEYVEKYPFTLEIPGVTIFETIFVKQIYIENAINNLSLLSPTSFSLLRIIAISEIATKATQAVKESVKPRKILDGK